MARLLVWSQRGKTFTLGAFGPIDSFGNSYEISADEKITVAHPLEMNDDDILRWQQYLVKHGLKQPFEQIWELKINSCKDVASDRYRGHRIPYSKFINKREQGVFFNDFNGGFRVSFAGITADAELIDFDGKSFGENGQVEIKSIRVDHLDRDSNHVISYLDKCVEFNYRPTSKI